MNNLFKQTRTVFSCLSLFYLAACSDKADDPKQNEENELITTVHLHLTKPGGTSTMATWKDLTPDDANGRMVDTLFLEPSTLYTGMIELKDESKSPAVDISAEVKTEAVDHLFVYKQTPPSTPVYFNIVRTDKDSKNLETGLEYTLQTNATKGKTGLNVILKHQPGEKNGSESPGDTDIDVVIPVVVR
jgi:hypothetical protein